ncbi:hypothetical protein SCHPADRAFT_941232 [Schizopora paradoxa]|uniref:DUF6533 domain-containing protein n=1 Tax=Schizopora paradoxa TaxID=27342 RepID=A0A0H2RKI3_9AGAM|nr:hypothetical protein SCHPADRAFT_941232 [Schizopora paradoxa]
MSIASETIRSLTQEVNQYSLVAGTVLLFYDCIVHFSNETAWVWRRGRIIGRILYSLARYSGIVDAACVIYYCFCSGLTPESCRIPYEIGVWSMTIGIALCHVVLIVRTFAVFERSTRVLIYMCAIQALAVAFKILLVLRELRSVTFIQSPLPDIVACVPILTTDRNFIAYCIDIAFEFNILCLSLYKGIHEWRDISTPLTFTLYRDGIFYFAILFCVSFTNAIIGAKMYRLPLSTVLILYDPFSQSEMAGLTHIASYTSKDRKGYSIQSSLQE